MRLVNSDILNAIEADSYRIVLSATIEPSRVVIEEFDTNNAPSFADISGTSGSPFDEPIMQDIAYDTAGSTFATFYNHSGTLKYQIHEDSEVITTSISLDGKPGIYGNKIFLLEGTTLKRYDLNWINIAAKSSSPFSNGVTIDNSYYTSGAGFVHGVSETECVVFEIDDGGFRTHYHKLDGSWTRYGQANRFIFPKIVDLTPEGETTRTLMSYGRFSTALKIGNEIFAYISNTFSGTVDGIVFNPISNCWSDVFIAFPSDLNSSFSEFRIANSFVQNDKAFIVGQFIRYEQAEDYSPITLFTSSIDGKTFSVDFFTLVTWLPYRIFGFVQNGDLFIASCNRVASTTATYYFLNTNGPAAIAHTLTNQQLLGFTGTSFDIGVGNEELLYHEYMKTGSRMIVNIGYKTVNGFEYSTYGTYIIASFSGSTLDGDRRLTVNLVSMSEWFLTMASSPFYSEIISKSSLIDPMIEDLYMDPVDNLGISESEFSVDFWGNTEYTNDDLGITGVVAVSNGGATKVNASGAHKLGIQSQDLLDLFQARNYPIFSSGSPTLEIYGWSSDPSGGDNDAVGIILLCKDKDTLEEYIVEVEPTEKWPNTYQTSVSGDYPIQYTVPDCVIGDKLVKVILVFEADNSTIFCPVRVDFISGILKQVAPDNYNTSWTITDDKGYEIPGSGFPYIDFARKPYSAFNFILGAHFNNTVTGFISSLPCAVGLVGLAFDGANYIAGRYNKANGLLEIVKAVDHIETILTSGSPTTTIENEFDIMFSHHDGHFEIHIKDTGVWIKNLEYDWQDNDGYMVIDRVAFMKCGIYGYISMPYFYATGFDLTADENGMNSAGIAMLPGKDIDLLDLFPTLGNVLVGDNKYAYSSKNKPAEIRGPFQFRQNGDGTEGQYVEPYGDNSAGLECYDFDWLKSDSSYIGYIIALDDGYNYVCTGTKWQIWITSSGVVQYIRDRARYLAAGTEIGDYYHDLSNRIYMTGGLMNCNLIDGTETRQGMNSMVKLAHEGSMWCREFFGSSGDIDATVEDLIDRISKTSNAQAIFPGNVEVSSVELTTALPSYTVTQKNLVDGFDIRFNCEALSTNGYIQIRSDSQLRSYDQDQSSIRITKNGTEDYKLSFVAISSSGSPAESVISSLAFSMPDTAFYVRVLYHDNFATVYINNIWIFTFGMAVEKDDEDPLHDLEGIVYSPTLDIILDSNESSLTCNNICVYELADWREAIYVPMETTGVSAIQSVLQERPVEIIHKSDGSVSYCYEPDRDQIDQIANHILSHTWNDYYPIDGGSDAIVSYSDVKTLQHIDFMRTFGFSTKVISLPNLDVGALKAAKILLQKSYERSEIHDLTIRIDIRLEVGDILYIHYYASGTQKEWEVYIVIESLSFRVGDHGRMKVTGRKVTI